MHRAFIKIFHFFCIAALAFFVTAAPLSASAAESAKQFVLTKEEQAYLDSLRVRPITILYTSDLMRVSFGGVSYGMLDPFLDILRNTFGLEVYLVKTGWRGHGIFEQLKRGTADFYGPVAITEDRFRQNITVGPFFRSYAKVVSHVTQPVYSVLGLYNERVGLLEGSVLPRAVWAYLGPSGRIVYFPTMSAMMSGLSAGVIDAFFTVDNMELEVLQNMDMQLEFAINNFYVEQGFISENEAMRPLTALLNRYLEENPRIFDKIVELRKQALLQFTRERFANEIAFIQENYKEIVIFAPSNLYPLSYMEHGAIQGMQLEINRLFEELTGVGVRVVSTDEHQGSVFSIIGRMRAGEIQAYVGGYYDTNIRNDPAIEYSPSLWLETLRLYSYKRSIDDLSEKVIGAMHLSKDYLHWGDASKNEIVLYNNYYDLIRALKKGEVDAIFMGEMGFYYNYSILKDYSLREIVGISAEASRHVLYGAQNREVNTLFNEVLKLFPLINPQAKGQWESLSRMHTADLLRLRHVQQSWMMAAIIIFSVMLVALLYLLRCVWRLHVRAKIENRMLFDEVHHDALTGIYNRLFMEKSLKHIIQSLSRYGSTLSVLMIDVDFFKKYNDAYGHSMGDNCLKVIAETVAQNVTRIDDFVARYGGEEFIVVLPNTDESGARLLANKLLESIRERNILHEESDVADCVTISIGVATGVVEYTQSAVDYIKRADEALYMSKRGGRDRYTFLAME
jgi:diguanylate cyclase (GGDEF)-like protein